MRKSGPIHVHEKDRPAREDVLRAIIARLEEDLRVLTASQQQAQEGAVHEESRAESDKDTRGLEASYLARGLAQRVLEQRDALGALQALQRRAPQEGAPARLGALLALEEEDGACRWVFIAPAAGGMSVTLAGQEVRVVTPASPLGRALVGKESGEEIQVRTPQGARELFIRSCQ